MPALGRAEITALEMFLWALPGCHVYNMSWWQGLVTGVSSHREHPQPQQCLPRPPEPSWAAQCSLWSLLSEDTATVPRCHGVTVVPLLVTPAQPSSLCSGCVCLYFQPSLKCTQSALRREDSLSCASLRMSVKSGLLCEMEIIEFGRNNVCVEG